MAAHGQSVTPGFRLWPCGAGDGVDIAQVRHFMFDGVNLFVAWHEKTVFIIETPGPKAGYVANNHTVHEPAMLDAPVENFIRIGDSVRCLDKSGGFYELKQSVQPLPSDSAYEEDMFSDGEASVVKQYKFVKNLRLNKVVRLTSLKKGLALIKKQERGNAYLLNFYTNQLEKKFSVHLAGFAPKDEADCFLVWCAHRLEARMYGLLLKESPRSNGDMLFIGWGGNVYVVAADLSSASAPVPRLVYHSDHPVTTVLALEGPTGECRVVGIVLSVGCMVCVTSAEGPAASLRYTTAYLPTDTFRVLCSVQGCVVCGDGEHLWLCHLQLQPAIDLKAVMLPVKAVVAVAVVGGTDIILAVTLYGDTYWLSSSCIGESAADLTFNAVSACSGNVGSAEDILQAIREGSIHVQELNQQVSVEDGRIAGLNLATRVDTLRNYFELIVTVDCMESLLVRSSTVSNLWSPNTKGFYQVNVCIRNLTQQQFRAPTWSLAVSVRTGGETCTRLVGLEGGLSEHGPVQVRLPLAVPSPGAGSVDVDCTLVSRMLRPGKPWVLIPVGGASLDVSYFFELQTDSFPTRLLSRRDGAATLREDLVAMACSNNTSLQVELNSLRLLRNEELISTLKFHRPVEARSLWNVLLGQCRHRLSADVQTQYGCQSGDDAGRAPRMLVVHAGCEKVAVSLDSSRTTATLSCSDVRVLHAVRMLIASRLATLKKSGVVHIALELFHKADSILPALEEMDVLQMQKALRDWRKHSSQKLPF